ncbi:hypothetical protein [Dyadobacter sediminis]|uniref:Uncharacterized protein n=1 Tax=Dyadobacter sediminis TaxID=1493691 RepID=A0A5R9KBN8_9BACT|nr:hypothetical protein [Dyadobacter sediminis]TLU92226.1 hypothetical protein FEM55_15915 [Dyadobacter sediminis]GGB96389.1 hypothetical protein GCM10011325_24630 [Dyadobacter sediminis]
MNAELQEAPPEPRFFMLDYFLQTGSSSGAALNNSIHFLQDCAFRNPAQPQSGFLFVEKIISFAMSGPGGAT